MTYTICYPFMMNWMGGSLESAFQLAQKLPRSYDPVLAFPAHGEASERAKKYGLYPDFVPLDKQLMMEFTEVSSYNRLQELVLGAKTLPYIWRSIQYLKNKEVDLVHTNDLRTTIFWGIAARLTSIPIIWHVRQEDTSDIWDHVRVMLSDHVIFCSKTITRSFDWADLDGGCQSVVHNGIDPEQFYPRADSVIREEININKDDYLIGFVGNLVDRKRPLMFVNAAIELLKQRNDCHFILVGDDRNDISKDIDKMTSDPVLNNKIRYLGYRDDVPQIMSDIDMLVLTSTKSGEAFPRVILEAMASETTVVTTNAAGVSEVVSDGKTGRVIDANSTAIDLSNTINKCLNQDQCMNRYATKSRQIITSSFTNQNTTNKIADIYRDIICD